MSSSDVNLRFEAPEAGPGDRALRNEVRSFLNVALADHPMRARAASWSSFDEAFSRAVGQRGWIGMTWPRRYGGQERTASERYVVIEEMLAAGAPVAAHWFGDRQTGPLLLRYGTDDQRSAMLPRLASGEHFICIGMSEPGAGSDLASLRTRAERTADGWLINGLKQWTSHAHRCHTMVLLCRTGDASCSRRTGLSQLLVDMRTPGIRVRPMRDLSGAEHFCEVAFDDALVPESALLGTEGQGWNQVMGELALERSGPERFLSSMTLLSTLNDRVKASPTPDACRAMGRAVAHLVTLRTMSRGVARMLDSTVDPSLHGAIVKDLGASFEQSIPELARSLVEATPTVDGPNNFEAALGYTILNSPAYSIRGGTREILRGIIARALGLR